MKRLVYAEDVVKEIDEWLEVVGTSFVGKNLSYYGELLGCIEDAPTVEMPQWIPCSERLPKEFDYPEQRYRVLVSCYDGIVRDATIRSMLSGEKHFCHGYEFVYEAWMPLPEPYKLKQKSDWKDHMMQHFVKGE